MELVLTDQNFDDQIKSATKPVLVDMYADWCGPCKLMEPTIAAIASEMEGKMIIAKLDVDNSPQTSLKFGVMSIPTMIFFKNGTEVKRLIGYQDKGKLISNINEILQ